VLGGVPGIGKDTLLEPVKYAVGPWNFEEVSPKRLHNSPFNPYLKSVILRVSEARDEGEFDRFSFYETTKTMWAAPPDILSVNDKNMKFYPILNILGGVITTNHRSDALFLPPDDRRHFCLWSNKTKEDFSDHYWNKFWRWYDVEGSMRGVSDVAAFLVARDLSKFDPKKPPVKTAAFWDIVNSSRSSEESEIYDALEQLDWPDALTIDQIIDKASADFTDWLRDRKNRKAIHHRFECNGYAPLHNPAQGDGRWKVGQVGRSGGKNKVVYVRVRAHTQTLSDGKVIVRKALDIQEQHAAVAKFIERQKGTFRA
jgi:hypothetical protein